MVTPGLLPEPGEPRPSPLRWVLGLVVLGFLLLVGLLVVQVVRLRAERTEAQAEIDRLLGELKRPASAAAPAGPGDLGRRLEALEARVGHLEAREAPEESGSSSAPARPPDLRALPETREGGRLGELEARVAVRRAAGRLAGGRLRHALAFLSEAIGADPAWFRKFRPRDFFDSPGEYERVMADLERRVRENPLDSEAKTLLAWFAYHEKGPAHAKALLLEAVAASPENAEAREFLEALDK